jgi:predicted ATPase
MADPHYTEIVVPRPNDLGGGEWRLTNLTNLVAVFGKNGSGKSRLLRAWRDSHAASSHYVIPERTGELDYQPQFMGQGVTAEARKEQSQRNFHENYRRLIVIRIQAYLMARGGYSGAGPAPCAPEELQKAMGRLLPDFDLRIIPAGLPPYELRRASNEQAVNTIDQLSSGEAQLLLLGLDILTVAAMWEIAGTEARVMLIDEPDAHVHPDLLVRFADFLTEAAETYRFQTIIATHSPSLLAALGQFGGGGASVLYLDRVGTDFNAHPFDNILKELASCLGGHALMGPLFGVPLLLVEGDDDYRIWSQVPRHHVVSFSVLPSGGQQILNHQRALERVLNALGEPGEAKSGYALIDGDKGKPQENAETPQQHIGFIQLNCRESENLFLTDEVLATLDGVTWEQAQVKIDAEAANFGAKEEALRAVINCDRRLHDLKPVMEPLSLILDPKRVHWTVRVAAVIGKSRPNGHIGEFLGAEVVTALWGEAAPEATQPAEAVNLIEQA